MALERAEGRRRRDFTVQPPRPDTQILDEARRAEGRAGIAREALPLFLRYGYHGTPVRLIAKASGISVGSIFNYFSGKEEILLYILEENHREGESAVELGQRELEARSAHADPEAAFLDVYRRYTEAIDRVRRYTLLAYQETKTLSLEQRKPLFDRDWRILRLLKEVAQPAIDAGIFSADSLDLKVASLMHLSQAWAVRRWILPQYASIDEYWDDLEGIALAIMKSSKAPGDRLLKKRRARSAPAKSPA
jgi:AcrR family transcriptional regulator